MPDRRSPERSVRLGVTLLAAVTLLGALWYWLVEGFSAVNALYQAVITISTVGFAEAEPLGERGRLFTVVFLVVGVAVALYTLVALAEEVLEHQIGRLGRWRMERHIEDLAGHVILCGYGRVGTEIAPMIRERSKVVVVDADEARCEAAASDGYLVVNGDATEDGCLEHAGVRRASILIVSVQSDADAISTVLSARSLNPELRIVSRANGAGNEAKLRRAGVDHVVNPLHLGAQRLATFALQPAVADFMDVVMPEGAIEYRLEELVVADTSPVSGRTVGETDLFERTGTLLLAIRRPGGDFEANPGADSLLEAGATIIAIGQDPQLGELADRLAERR